MVRLTYYNRTTMEMNLHDGMGKISGVWVGFGGVVRLTYYNCTTTEMKGGGVEVGGGVRLTCYYSTTTEMNIHDGGGRISGVGSWVGGGW